MAEKYQIGQEVALPGCGARRMRIDRIEEDAYRTVLYLSSVNLPVVNCSHVILKNEGGES